MRQLLPHPRPEVSTGEAYRFEAKRTPWIVALMASTADGATAIGGLSAQIGGDCDRAVFEAVRSQADAVLVASGTVRAENYGLPKHAPLVVVSGRLSLTPELRIFEPPAPGQSKPIVIHGPMADESKRAALQPLADLRVVQGENAGSISAQSIVQVLDHLAFETVILEGGPTLNGLFVEADLIDELCLTLDPTVAGGDSRRIVHGFGLGQPREFETVHLLESEGTLFWRLRRQRD